MTLKLVPKHYDEPPGGMAERCHFKLVQQYGRGGNRKAIYVCQSHAYPSGCLPFAARGWTNIKGKKK